MIGQWLQIGLVAAAAACLSSAAAAQTSPSLLMEIAQARTTMFDGLVYRRFERGGAEPVVTHILEVDLARPGIRWAVTPGDRSRGMEQVAQLTTTYLERSGAAAAVNASYFLPFVGGSQGGEDYYPKPEDPVGVSGAAIAGGSRVSPPEYDRDRRVDAMICFHGSQLIVRDGQRCPSRYRDGVAAGPRLLANGGRSAFTTGDRPYALERNPRTAIGISRDSPTAWIVVVDGRQPEYSVGMSLEELADLFVVLGAHDAINLDGGGSSAMAIRSSEGQSKLVSRPIHTGVPGRERPVANHIVIFAQPELP